MKEKRVKFSVVSQGTVIVEDHDGEFWILLPDGTTILALTKAEVERKVKAWAKRHLGGGMKVGFATIEWR